MGQIKKRAVRADDKERKRDLLLEAAMELFDRATDMEEISMERIAARAGVAKGTLYLYFRTKEEIFLEIHRQDYAAWFEAFTAYLRESPAGLPPERLVDWVVASLRENERFMRIHALVAAALEKNVGFESARRFKSTLRASVLAAAPELARVLELKDEARVFALLTHFHALLIGLWNFSHPNEVIREVLASDEEFAILALDFYEGLADGLTMLLRGVRT